MEPSKVSNRTFLTSIVNSLHHIPVSVTRLTLIVDVLTPEDSFRMYGLDKLRTQVSGERADAAYCRRCSITGKRQI